MKAVVPLVIALSALIWSLCHTRAGPAPPGAGTPPARAAPPPGAVPVRVVRVVDGDTLVVRWPGGRAGPVRLIGVDAPEPVPAGGAARRALAALAPPGAGLVLAADREPRDAYGRDLRYAWTAGGRFVNAELVRAGHARAMVVPPNERHAALLRHAEATASSRFMGNGGEMTER
ncbi:thermonuclease family protein [Actinomadura craniellae]|uniref:thermonuclease family protein n=1 Tax=Actinomadura craniellae TaxID=2231787 RepID=UPI001313FE86|nr:thermonuclease family protein [Actinomadura craniellae]